MDIIAFKGYRYDAKVVGEPGNCISPPYDVIDAEQRETLYEQSPYNIARVIKGKDCSTDTEKDNVYTRSAEALRGFISEGALKAIWGCVVVIYISTLQIHTPYLLSRFSGEASDKDFPSPPPASPRILSPRFIRHLENNH